MAEIWRKTGTTQAGRRVVLTGTRPEATLDGQPVELLGLQNIGDRQLGEGWLLRTAEDGTFTAIEDGSDPELHSVLLRKHVDAEPADGWEVSLIRSWEVDGGPRFAFRVGSDWRDATLEIYLEPGAAASWAESGGGRSLEQLAEDDLRRSIHGAEWPSVEERARHPKTIIASAHAPDPYRR